MPLRGRLAGSCALGLAVLTAAPPAGAAEILCDAVAPCIERRNAAIKLYEAKKYESALIEFQSAYAHAPEPRLLINIGRTMFRLERPNDALATFERYVSLVKTPPDDVRGPLERYMREAREAADHRAPAGPSLAAPISNNIVPGSVFTAFGGAFLVAGLATGLVAKQTQTKFEDLANGSESMYFNNQLVDLERRGRTLNAATLGLSITGGLLVVVGVPWLIIAAKGQRARPYSAGSSSAR